MTETNDVLSSCAVPPSELRLIRRALDLGATEVGGPLSNAERALVEASRALPPTAPELLARDRQAILTGEDPLGEAFCRVRAPVERRARGAFYTPPELVEPMVARALSFDPVRVVDAGCGSGRFAAAVARRRPSVPIVAVDLDPVATLLTRATMRVLAAESVQVLQADYTDLSLPSVAGRTAYLGNPPYVRHHDLPPELKKWAARVGRWFGLTFSGLSGLHAYFYLATANDADPGDVGCFVTSAEWLDVNYGSALRQLFLANLGGTSLHRIDPRAVPFADAMTTAVIACFEVGAPPEQVRLRLIDHPRDLRTLDGGHLVAAELLRQSSRWTPFFQGGQPDGAADGTVELGTLARVHRGIVTGANDFFILTRERATELGLSAWCRPAITGADEVLQAEGVIRDGPERRVLLDVPADVDRGAHPRLDAYLRLGEEPRGSEPPISTRYIPSHRRPWWFLGRWKPAPIVASYMARQAPRFALNPDDLAIVNVLHGIYPRQDLPHDQLCALVQALNRARDSYRGNGRTYHGGLEKFEPREMETLRIAGW